MDILLFCIRNLFRKKTMSAGISKSELNGLRKFDRFKMEAAELRSIKGGGWHIYYINGEIIIVWVEEQCIENGVGNAKNTYS